MKTISINWHAWDILALAKELKIELNEAEADHILATLERQHDASIGINWEVIRTHIYYFDDEREDKKHRELMKYPFNEGDDYWTIDNAGVTWSCWDSVSEELHDLNPNKIYFNTELEAQNYLTQLTQIV